MGTPVLTGGTDSVLTSSWLRWISVAIVSPFLITLVLFALPLALGAFIYVLSLFLHLYKWLMLKVELYGHDIWMLARKIIAFVLDIVGKIWHGYEVVGLENIPRSGPALIIYYHGAFPIDVPYLMAKCILYRSRKIRAFGDNFLSRVPGFKPLMDVYCVDSGTIEYGVKLMNDGHILALSPGGTREALFSDKHYKMIWGTRRGFAEIAVQAKVPVIPMFTQNCRESFRAITFFRRLLRQWYERCRLPVVPIYGGFPVKMRTFIGEPIPYAEGVTPKQLSRKVQRAIQEMIDKHQRVPGSIGAALLDRLNLNFIKYIYSRLIHFKFTY